MPPARGSAAAEETKRRTSGATNRPEQHDTPATLNATGVPPSTFSGIGGDEAGLGSGRMNDPAEVDWNAIFRTIEGHGGQDDGAGPIPFAYAPRQSGEYQQTAEAGPSRRGLAPIQTPPYSLDELLGSQSSHQWTHDPFLQVNNDIPPQISDNPLNLPRPFSPNRSQSYPFDFTSDYQPLHVSSGPSSSRERNDNEQEMLPPPIPPFGFPLNPGLFLSSSTSSSPVLRSLSSGYDYGPIPSPQQGIFDKHPQNIQTAMLPPSQSPGGPSNYTPRLLSRQTSSTNSPAPTPLSNPASSEDAEDKRGRNTAASAKFRAKKKDAIATVQRNISELEVQQAGLEADVASLRSENGLLREMVQIKFGTSIPKN